MTNTANTANTADSAPEVQVTGGRLRGRMDGEVAAFLGIPYAAPPFGTRRLRPPEPPARWEGLRAATGYGPTCPKGDYAPDSAELFPEVVIPGEECLNLNVWTPDPGGSGLPVLVWIHGGMFTKGSGSVPGYRGTSFARDGVVCVTINYRLGAEGFLHLDDGISNLGLLDQIAALEWVRREIAAFGGDPGKVTVAGQSAGAMSVITLMATPRARGLFSQAVAQSGAVAQTLTAETAAGIASQLAGSLGVAATREAFREVPAARLARAASALADKFQTAANPAEWASLPFAPVIDGDLLPEHPLDALRKGAGRGVRLLAGGNRHDTRIGLVPTGMIDLIDESALAAVAAALGAPDGTVERYRAARPGASPGELLAAVTTDCFIRVPAIRVAEARIEAGAADTWLYRFDHESPSFAGRLGAAHAVELPYVFDLLDDESGHALIGGEPPQAVADTAHGAWVRFVADGDPGWPRYDLAGRSTALIDEKITVAGDPDGAEREAWSGRR
ncbi:carboxylesterase family protein [Nonomuraea phyllanthi]|uniref:Carboxylic ester hydrolase n=1 Tax=Nonomuraea phyllanthi TaxID=2219224 RepID=A0A5C4WKD2_9ACTN|nr:carboxylesterase family protein [Nonomuraea phyllanthi]KAB8194727.1 carboxylesterase family protein [Nonomuraea phyllanthi]